MIMGAKKKKAASRAGDGFPECLDYGCLLMFKQLEELIELRQDDDPGPAIGGAAFFRIVGGYGNIFAPAGSGNMRGIQSILFLQNADDRGSALDAEIPVVFDLAGMVVGLVIRMPFHHEFDIRLR